MHSQAVLTYIIFPKFLPDQDRFDLELIHKGIVDQFDLDLIRTGDADRFSLLDQD